MILPKEKLDGLNPNFATTLTLIASRLPFTLIITEGVPATKEGSHVEHSEHFDGLGVDVRVADGSQRMAIVKAALAEGIKRIGTYDAHVHLGASTTLPQDVLWVGVSK